MDDPFFVVKDEVQKSIAHLQELYESFKKLSQQTSKRDQINWTTEEIKTSIKTIEWDIQDLEETIRVVEGNPQKFKLDSLEVSRRKQFVERSKSTLSEISRAVNSLSSSQQQNQPNKNMNFNANLDDDNSFNYRDNVIREEHEQQQIIMKKQDTQMDGILSTVTNMKNVAITLGDELDDQAILLDALDNKVDNTQNKLSTAANRLNKFYNDNLKDNTGRCIIILTIIVIILLILVVAF